MRTPALSLSSNTVLTLTWMAVKRTCLISWLCNTCKNLPLISSEQRSSSDMSFSQDLELLELSLVRGSSFSHQRRTACTFARVSTSTCKRCARMSRILVKKILRLSLAPSKPRSLKKTKTLLKISLACGLSYLCMLTSLTVKMLKSQLSKQSQEPSSRHTSSSSSSNLVGRIASTCIGTLSLI